MGHASLQGAYPSSDLFFEDLTPNLPRRDRRTSPLAGAVYVQLDEVAVAQLVDPAVRAKVAGGR